jgi:hypothetical protein
MPRLFNLELHADAGWRGNALYAREQAFESAAFRTRCRVRNSSRASLSPAGTMLAPLLLTGRGITVGAISAGSRADFEAMNRPSRCIACAR